MPQCRNGRKLEIYLACYCTLVRADGTQFENLLLFFHISLLRTLKVSCDHEYFRLIYIYNEIKPYKKGNCYELYPKREVLEKSSRTGWDSFVDLYFQKVTQKLYRCPGR